MFIDTSQRITHPDAPTGVASDGAATTEVRATRADVMSARSASDGPTGNRTLTERLKVSCSTFELPARRECTTGAVRQSL